MLGWLAHRWWEAREVFQAVVGRVTIPAKSIPGPSNPSKEYSRPYQSQQRVFQALSIPAKSIPGCNNPEQRVFQAQQPAKRPSSLEVGVAGVLLLLRGVQKFLHGPFCARTFKGVLSKYTKKETSHFQSSEPKHLHLGLILFLDLSECIYFPIFRLVNLVGLTHFLVAS